MKEHTRITIKITEAILEHQNGYSKQEIKERNMGESCIGSDIFTAIENIVKKEITKPKKPKLNAL